MERSECLSGEVGRWRGSDMQPCEFISSAYKGGGFTKVLPEVPVSSHRPEKERVLGGGGVADSVFTHNELCPMLEFGHHLKTNFKGLSLVSDSEAFAVSSVSSLDLMDSGYSIETG